MVVAALLVRSPGKTVVRIILAGVPCWYRILQSLSILAAFCRAVLCGELWPAGGDWPAGAKAWEDPGVGRTAWLPCWSRVLQFIFSPGRRLGWAAGGICAGTPVHNSVHRR